jgi:hypothetical protein
MTEVISHSKLASTGKTSETAVLRTAIKESNSRLFCRIKVENTLQYVGRITWISSPVFFLFPEVEISACKAYILQALEHGFHIIYVGG